MRSAGAAALAFVALAGAVYLGSLRLDTRACDNTSGVRESPTVFERQCAEYAPAHGVWQLPVAAVIAGLGLGGAVVVARGT
jgi:hypothetical protein